MEHAMDQICQKTAVPKIATARTLRGVVLLIVGLLSVTLVKPAIAEDDWETVAPPAALDNTPDSDWLSYDSKHAVETGECFRCADGCNQCSGKGACGGMFTLNGWIDQGFTWNPDSPANNFNLPVTFNDRANEYQLNQIYLSAERRVCEDGCSYDLGGRVDLLYGTDYFFTQSNGLELRRDGSPRWNSSDGPRGTGGALYGLALPQLYAELYAPVGNGLNVKLGHFYTIIGYESVMAPHNFFYSHSYSMQYGEPKTHTGLLARYPVSDQVTIQGGVTRGWDTWDGQSDEFGFLGGLSWISADRNTTVDFALHTGNEDPNGENNRTMFSLIYSHQFCSGLHYTFQSDFGIEDNVEINGNGQLVPAKWYSFVNYLTWPVAPCVDAGVRFEIFRDQDNARVLANPNELIVFGGNYYAVTCGLNWQVFDNAVVRPELRWDWSDVEVPIANTDGPFDDFSDKDQFLAALDIIVRF